MKVVSIQYNLQYLFFYRELLKDDPAFLIPGIEDELTTHEVLTSEFVEGLPLDKCFELDQESKNKVIIQNRVFRNRFLLRLISILLKSAGFSEVKWLKECYS